MLFLVCYDLDNCWYNEDKTVNSGIEDASICTTHMMLEAYNIGLGSCWINLIDYSKCKEVFNLDDNIVPLFEMYPDIENFFITIARDGATYGIYLLYSANSTSGVRYKIIQNVKGAISFELTDKGDYPSIVGRPEESLAKILGRAYFKGNPPTVFQAAIPFKCSSDREATELIQKECIALASSWTGSRAKPIPVMPEYFSENMLLHVFSERWMIPVGMAYDTIEPFAFDLSERYSLLITGSIHSGKSKALIRIINYLLNSADNQSVIVFDSKLKSLSSTKEIVDSYAT